jgi:SAM-dependent methyltransferase
MAPSGAAVGETGGFGLTYWIISGPSSVGKTSFIRSPRCAEITGLPPETPVVWASEESGLDDVESSDAFIHYNMLRSARIAQRDGGNIGRSATRFDHDKAWTSIIGRSAQKRAVVLVTSTQTMKDRISQRTTSEESAFLGVEGGYRPQRFLKLLEKVDLADVYGAWCAELRNRGVPYVLVDSSDDSYPIIEDEKRLPEILDGRSSACSPAQPEPQTRNGEASAYTREQIMELLRAGRFGYHRIELPYGLHTRGQDRSETRDLIFPESLTGKSVLDVGPALGYFCFEAEARGAARIVGVELRDDRFRDAILLKEIKRSNVEFIQRDIVLDPIEEQFDFVLLLNVLHHLYEPFRALRQLASITRERLVLEFPTTADQKFQASLDVELPPECESLPLIGVSSMQPGIRETFVYTPAAIQRVLMDHERLFDSVEIVRSPMLGRAIALCHKGPSGGQRQPEQWPQAAELRRVQPGRQRRQRRRERSRQVVD